MQLIDILLTVAILLNIFNNVLCKKNINCVTPNYCLPVKCLEVNCSASMKEHGYVISQVTREDMEDAIDFMRRTFFIDEPLNKAVRLCPGGTGCPELEEFCRQDLVSGYSVMATDAKGKIISISINAVVSMKKPMEDKLTKQQAKRMKNPKFQKILYIIANQEENAKVWEKYPNETIAVEIKMVATSREWRRKGIMTRLLIETEKLAISSRIRLLRVNTSSYFSALGVEKLGFRLIYSILYSELKMNGKPIILPAYPHIDDRLFIKRLDISKHRFEL